MRFKNILKARRYTINNYVAIFISAIFVKHINYLVIITLCAKLIIKIFFSKLLLKQYY
jgi:hypothetical protein